MSPRKRSTGPGSGVRRQSPPPPKIQRWIDLIAALLRRHYGVTFEDLRRDVPAYAEGRSRDTILRMFERDKDELRELGVAIATVLDEEGEPAAYRLRATDFYLPYLALVTGGVNSGAKSGSRPAPVPRRAERAGYRSLARLAFEPEELAAIADAAERVRQLDDPVLANDAASAVRKLAFDLPVGTLAANGTVTIVTRSPAADHTFELLDTALRRRKLVTFEYRSMERDECSRRTVEPYGLFFLGSHWYLAGRDTARDALRNFRLHRIAAAEMNRLREHTPDYEIPRDFDLRGHAESRHAWELGDGDAVDAVVAFLIADGAAAAAARLGDPVNGDAATRRFRVRRAGPFVRWLLSFAGDARPVSPASIVDAFRRCAKETKKLYDSKEPT